MELLLTCRSAAARPFDDGFALAAPCCICGRRRGDSPSLPPSMRVRASCCDRVLMPSLLLVLVSGRSRFRIRAMSALRLELRSGLPTWPNAPALAAAACFFASFSSYWRWKIGPQRPGLPANGLPNFEVASALGVPAPLPPPITPGDAPLPLW